MKKFFYMVEYEYTDGEIVGAFSLGVFSTKKNATKKIEISRKLPGFDIYGDLFKIIKFAVDFDYQIEKKDILLYYVWLEYDDNYEIFDYYSTKEKAVKHIDFYRKHTRIGRKYPSFFQVSEVVVDDYNSWSEGFDK